MSSLFGKIVFIFRICLLCSLFLTFEAKGQGKQIEHQQFHWIRYTNQLILSDKWRIITDIDNRRFMFPDKQLVSVFRMNALYSLGEGWRCGGGWAYFLQSPNDPQSISTLKVPEIRFHQDFIFQKQTKKITFIHSYRIEERFFRKTQGEELAEGYRFNFRFRYRLQADYPILKGKNDKNILRIRIFDEIFINAGNQIVRNVFDQNRIYVGLNYQFSPAFSIDTGYMNSFQQLSSGIDFYSRHIFRFFVIHTVQLKKSKN